MNTKKLAKQTREDIVSKGFVQPNLYDNMTDDLKYPMDLVKEKTMHIHVYNTSKADNVYDGLLATTQNVISRGTNLFGNLANKALSATSGLTGITSRFTSNVSLDDKGLLSGKGFFGTEGTGLTDLYSNFVNAMPTVDLGIGNARLFGRYDYYHTFHLPIPNDIQESISNEYEEQDGWLNDAPMMGEGGTIRSGIEKGAKMSTTWTKLTGARSLKYWENKIQMYSSSSFREITLTWQLVPNNAKEANIIHEMVRRIKMYGSPESAAGKLILKSPCFFGIEFNNTTLNEALQFQEVVLIAVNIDYVPGGVMETHKDGQPKQIQLTMTFRDRQPKLQEDWANPKGLNNAPSKNENACPQK